MVFAALVFDVLDGRIARWRQKTSGMGRELDSLADVISFGVAPALIGYGCGMQGFYDRIVLTYFVACGVSRLARYNITTEALSEGGGKVKYFEGTPIPTGFRLTNGQSHTVPKALIAPMPGVHKEVEPSLVALSGSLAQSLDFLAGTKKPSFPNRKLITSAIVIAYVSKSLTCSMYRGRI